MKTQNIVIFVKKVFGKAKKHYTGKLRGAAHSFAT